MIKAIAVINAVCLWVVLLCVSVEIPAFNPAFYGFEYDKYGIPAHIKVSGGDLMTVTDRLLAYMKGNAPDLVLETTVAGERREFFNQREKDHMADVRNLILAGYLIRNGAAAIVIASFVICGLWRKRFPAAFAWAVKRVFIGFFILAAILAALVAMNFDRAFTIFHMIFFNNDLWILNPDTDLLVNIVPFGFFMDISGTIAVIFMSFNLLAIVLSSVYTKVKRVQEPLL